MGASTSQGKLVDPDGDTKGVPARVVHGEASNSLVRGEVI